MTTYVSGSTAKAVQHLKLRRSDTHSPCIFGMALFSFMSFLPILRVFLTGSIRFFNPYACTIPAFVLARHQIPSVERKAGCRLTFIDRHLADP